MARRKGRFTTEFKLQAVRLVEEGSRSMSEVARELKVPLSTLHQWVRKAETGASRASDESEVARLRRELEQVRMERDFLKKAAAFFAKHQQ
jgi:transposase